MYYKLGQIKNNFVKDTNIFLEMSLKSYTFDIFLQFLESSTCHVTIKIMLSNVRHVRSLELTLI